MVAERHRFWHTFLYIFSTHAAQLSYPGHSRLGHQEVKKVKGGEIAYQSKEVILHIVRFNRSSESIGGFPNSLAQFDRELLSENSYETSDVINDVTQG